MDQRRLMILRSFRSVVNGNKLTEEIYNSLLKDWGFENLDLNEEIQKINLKTSYLSKAEREAVNEFIILKNILEKRKQQEEQISFTNTNDQSNQIISPIIPEVIS